MENIWGLYSLFTSSIFVIAVAFSFYLFIIKKHGLKNALELSGEKVSEFSPTIKFLLLIVVLLILIGFWMPYLLTRKAIYNEFDFTDTGAIGDTFGGILNPFVALAAVIVTGLAFYVQYQANNQSREQFNKSLIRQKELFNREMRIDASNLAEQRDTESRKNEIQSFESQFYELLKLHRENVNELFIELNIKSASSGTSIKGRRVFMVFTQEILVTYTLLSKVFRHYYKITKKEYSEKIFNLSYCIFFEGIYILHSNSVSQLSTRLDLDEHFIIYAKRILGNIFEEYPSSINKPIKVFSPENEHITDCSYDFHPFVGQSSRIGHYFRHLFFIAKFVANKNSKLFDYSLKRYYLRILRNQLSNDEQVLLYYNWLSGYGASWEQKDLELRKCRKGNFFFTDYRMIHNVYINNFIDGMDFSKNFDLPEYKSFLFERGRKLEDHLFEIHEISSDLLEDENDKLQE